MTQHAPTWYPVDGPAPPSLPRAPAPAPPRSSHWWILGTALVAITLIVPPLRGFALPVVLGLLIGLVVGAPESRWGRQLDLELGGGQRAQWLALRLGLAAATASGVVAGHLSVQLSGSHHGSLDGGFFAFLLLDLLPAIILAAGARRRSTVAACGFTMFVLTQLAWLGYVAGRHDPLAGIWVGFAFLVNLLLAIIAVANDHSG